MIKSENIKRGDFEYLWNYEEMSVNTTKNQTVTAKITWRSNILTKMNDWEQEQAESRVVVE